MTKNAPQGPARELDLLAESATGSGRGREDSMARETQRRRDAS